MLLFVVPGLHDLRSGDKSDGPNRILTATSWTILFLLWKDFRHGVDVVFGEFDPDQTNAFPADWPHLSFFVFRDLAWWSVVAVLAAFIGLFLWQSPTARALVAGGAAGSTPKPEGEIACGTPRAGRKALLRFQISQSLSFCPLDAACSTTKSCSLPAPSG
jgi:hypothetical protein